MVIQHHRYPACYGFSSMSTSSSTQSDSTHASQLDSGLHCLILMAQLHGIAADAAQLNHQFGSTPFSVQTLLLAARKLGLTAKCIQQDMARLERAPLPAIGIWQDGGFLSWVR
jgi:subfamily B ATP-binding cassette protein HlyB/CyaB